MVKTDGYFWLQQGEVLSTNRVTITRGRLCQKRDLAVGVSRHEIALKGAKKVILNEVNTPWTFACIQKAKAQLERFRSWISKGESDVNIIMTIRPGRINTFISTARSITHGTSDGPHHYQCYEQL